MDFLMEICESSGGDQMMLKMDHSLRKPVVIDNSFKMVKSPVDLPKGGACKKKNQWYLLQRKKADLSLRLALIGALD